MDSWKDISEYLRKDVSTLIRWRKERGLPVYGIPGGKRQGVFAYRDEIDQWLRSGSGFGTRDPGLGDREASQANSATPAQNASQDGPQHRGAASSAPTDRRSGTGVRGSGNSGASPPIAECAPGATISVNSRAVAGKPGPSGQNAAILSGSEAAALTPVVIPPQAQETINGLGCELEARAPGLVTPERARAAVTPGASTGLAWRGWHSAAWLGLVVCLISLFSYLLWPRGEPQVLGFTQLTNDGCKKERGRPFLTNGVRVYFWEDRGAGMVLASVPVDGGDAAEVRIPAGFLPTAVSKNGSEFLGDESTRRGAQSLAKTPTSGGSLHWLLQPPEPGSRAAWRPDAAWSPHGNRIAFAVQNDVFEARADGNGMRKVAHVDGWTNWPRWSPDGRRICFSVLKPKAQRWRLWEVNADGTRLHPLDFPGCGFTETGYGDWTPDGKFLIFEAEQGGRHDIWAVRERGARFWAGAPEPVRLTSGPLNYYCPLPSRDGKEIFVRGEESRGELMRFDLKSRAFVDFLGGISAAEVDFSKDGRWIAYVTYPDYTLWRARSDGSNALQLTCPPLEAREPHWSRDGQQIAFQGISPGPRYKIYIVPSSGGHVREAVPGGGEQSVATWFPDGHSLLYDEPLYRHDVSQMSIYRLDLKTGKSYKIPGSARSWTARLSPDGRYIATLDATPTANPHHLFILDTATGRRTRMVTMPELAEPTWSRDGQYVYFAVIGSPRPALYRVRVQDKKVELLTSLRGFPVAGLWTGVAPDGSPLLLRDISTEEIYALRLRLPCADSGTLAVPVILYLKSEAWATVEKALTVAATSAQ